MHLHQGYMQEQFFSGLTLLIGKDVQIQALHRRAHPQKGDDVTYNNLLYQQDPY